MKRDVISGILIAAFALLAPIGMVLVDAATGPTDPRWILKLPNAPVAAHIEQHGPIQRDVALAPPSALPFSIVHQPQTMESSNEIALPIVVCCLPADALQRGRVKLVVTLIPVDEEHFSACDARRSELSCHGGLTAAALVPAAHCDRHLCDE